MPKFHVICSHPNAGDNINGFAFEKHKNRKRTVEPVDEAGAAQFRDSEHFEVVAIEEPPKKKAGERKEETPPPPPPADGEKTEGAAQTALV